MSSLESSISVSSQHFPQLEQRIRNKLPRASHNKRRLNYSCFGGFKLVDQEERAPDGMAKYAPYIVAVAELEDCTRLLAQITGVTPATLKVDLPIQVVSRQIAEDRITYKFKPL